jgi:hypothetical protein
LLGVEQFIIHNLISSIEVMGLRDARQHTAIPSLGLLCT